MSLWYEHPKNSGRICVKVYENGKNRWLPRKVTEKLDAMTPDERDVWVKRFFSSKETQSVDEQIVVEKKYTETRELKGYRERFVEYELAHQKKNRQTVSQHDRYLRACIYPHRCS